MAGGKTTYNEGTRLNGVQIQSTAYGQSIPRGWGTFRVAATVLWMGGFQAIANRTTTRSGGKGGGGGAKTVTTTYSYRTALALGICSGPIEAIRTTYRDKSVFYGLTQAGLSLKTGAVGQTVWGHLSTNFPAQAINYSGIAYAYASAYDLNDNATMGNHSFEVQMPDRVDGSDDADPALIIEEFLSEIPFWAPTYTGDLTDFSNYCLSAGLLLSPVLDVQVEARSFVEEILRAANSDCVWSAGKFKVVPLGDAALAGNGATWEPNLTPVFELTEDDFLQDGGDDPIQIDINRPADAYNYVQIEFLDRARQYNPQVAPGIDQSNIDEFGTRKADVEKLHCIADATVAATVANLRVQSTCNVRRLFRFGLPENFSLLEPLDLLSLTSGKLNGVLVRINRFDENDDGSYEVEAEEVLVGSGSAPEMTRQDPGGLISNFDADPGDTNPPVLINPPRQLTENPFEVWVSASGGPEWGGCEIWSSIDGDTYQKVGQIDAPGRYGETASSLPLVADPDVTSTLAVDLSESGGTLFPATQAEVDAFSTLCLIGSEVIAYRDAVLTGASLYDLDYLRRGLMGTMPAAHPSGTRFIRLDEGVFELSYRDDQIGQTISLKFRSFNVYGRNYQELSDLDPYTVTLTPVSVLAPAAGSVTGAAGTGTGPGDTSIPTIEVASTASNPVAEALVVRYRAGAGDWSYHPPVSYVSGAAAFPISAVQPDTLYNLGAAHIIGGVLGDFLTLADVTTGPLTAGDVTANSPAMLEVFYRQVDEMLARTLQIVEEQGRQAVATTDTQRFIESVGRIDPATRRIDMRETAGNLLIGRSNMRDAVERVDDGFASGGFVRQPVPRDVSFLSGILNETMEATVDGALVHHSPDGPVVLGQVERVLEATGFVGYNAFIRRSPIDSDQGGRMFFERPLTNTPLVGNLALDVYQGKLRIFDATAPNPGVTLDLAGMQSSIGSKLMYTNSAGVFASDLTSATALRAPYARIGNGATGFLTLNEGDATRPGYAAFHTADLTRRGYVGFSDAVSKLIISGENGYNWAFDQRVDMLAGAAITGALTVSGLATLSGGAAVTGDITSSSAIHAASFMRVRNGSSGYIQNSPGDATYTGLTEFYNAAGTRLGYLGYGSGSTLVMAAEGSVTWAFDKQLRMLAGAAITGAASVIGGSLLVNTTGGAGTSAGRHINLGSVSSPTDWRTYSGNTTAAIQMENSSTEGFVLVATQGASVPRTQLITTGGFQLSVGATIGGAGTNAIQVLSNAKTGFGTAAPGSKVQISDVNSDYVASTAAFSVRKLEEGYGLHIGNASSGNSWLQAGYASGLSNYDLILQPNGGKVGVNTAAPEVAFHVAGGIRARNGAVGFITLESGDATNTGYVAFNNAAGTRYGYIGLVNTTAKVIDFRAENGAVFQFSGGAVTIDNSLTVSNSVTTSAGTGGLLTLGHYSGGYPWTLIRPDAGSTGFEFRTNAGDPLLNLNQSTRLATFGGNIDTIAGVNCKLTLRSATNYNWVIQAVGDDLKILEAGSISRVHIKYPSGFFGIDCVPTEKLQVNGRVMVTGSGYTANPVGGMLGYYSSTVPQTYIQAPSGGEVVIWDGPTNQIAVFTASKRFGLGTALPDNKLHVVDNSSGNQGVFQYGAGGRILAFGADGTGGRMQAYTAAYAASAPLILQPDGNYVGISTSGAPVDKLHVHGGGLVISGSSETITGPTSFTSLTGKMLQASYDATNNKAVIRSVYWGSYFTPLYFQGSEFRWATGSGSITERMILDVNGKLTINGTIARVGGDHHFAVDSGFGFYFDHNGTPCGLLEGNGRLSINALTVGGFGVGEWSNWAPTPTAESGTATGLAMVYARFTRVGKLVNVQLAVSQTAVGSAAGSVLVPLPYTAAATVYGGGTGENLNNAAVVVARVAPNATAVKLLVNNAYPMGAGAESLYAVFSYECV